jgi:choline dehydrogenase-like flavoprotein
MIYDMAWAPVPPSRLARRAPRSGTYATAHVSRGRGLRSIADLDILPAVFIQGAGTAERTYDAIVVGSGISGGWAAKELTGKGLRTLVLERGRDVKHPDYPTAMTESWEFAGRNRLPVADLTTQGKQARTGYTTHPASAHWFVNDVENPYSEVQRFDWMRGYHVGGRSLLWGRQSYRWSDLDFEANARDGHGVDWPIRYKDAAPWYDHVERFAGISGSREGLPQLPDSQFLPPMQMNCLERQVKERIAKAFDGRAMIIGRVANLTQPHNGRGTCQYRNRCIRGCPYGAYFSSNASTLPAAYATGRLTLRPFSIVTGLIYDPKTRKATGVRIVDAQTNQTSEYFARVIFLCASAIASTFILLNSKSERFPNGLGNDSGELGRNLMDHHFRVGATGLSDDFGDRFYKGHRPNGIYIPRFRNLDARSRQKDYVRGFGYQGSASRENWARGIKELSVFGADLKADLIAPGPWRFGIGSWGECLPYHENRMYLSEALRDKWGLPTVTFDCGWKTNELNMRKDMMSAAAEMLERAGLRNVTPFDDGSAPGLCIHEMGTARMGRDPKTSVLNGWNQVHAALNVFVTDGACMTSASCVNPSLTYMALTARACDHAVSEINKRNL